MRTVLGDDPRTPWPGRAPPVEEGAGALIAVGGDGMANLALQAVVGIRHPPSAGRRRNRQRLRPRTRHAPAGTGRGRPDDRRRPQVRPGPRHRLGRVGDRWFGAVLASASTPGQRPRQPDAAAPRAPEYDVAMVAELAAFRPLPYRITPRRRRGP
ncbi:hypothetical protein GCM10023238_10400 [Streptomyces heliomycini]